jgi:Second Messenger Oligonucleotide or Dinucleotide Synthetase domain
VCGLGGRRVLLADAVREAGARVHRRILLAAAIARKGTAAGLFSGCDKLGLAEWFSDFCSNVRVKETATISQRYKLITRRLNLEYYNTDSQTAHSLYVGSYGRNTAIDGFSDLDVLFQLPYAQYEKYNGYAGNGQSALLQAVKATIAKTYSSSDVGGDGQVVVVKFTDGIAFETVPGFLNKDGISYTHPNSNNGGSWEKTNPRAEIEAIRTRDAAMNGNLVRLCRMLRAWKATWDVPIKGLLIDTLAYQFIENWQYRDKSYFYYDYMCRDMFKWMSEQGADQEWWRAPGSAAYVWGKGLFQYKAKQCYKIACQAIAHETHTPSKQEYSAKASWREIFGTSFPQ